MCNTQWSPKNIHSIVIKSCLDSWRRQNYFGSLLQWQHFGNWDLPISTHWLKDYPMHGRLLHSFYRLFNIYTDGRYFPTRRYLLWVKLLFCIFKGWTNNNTPRVITSSSIKNPLSTIIWFPGFMRSTAPLLRTISGSEIPPGYNLEQKQTDPIKLF